MNERDRKPNPSSPQRGTRPERARERLPLGVEFKLVLARLALLQERLWPRVWPLLIVLFTLAAVSLFDLWRLVPGWVHAIALAGFASAAAVALYHTVTGWRFPRRSDGLARLEADSGLSFRPLRGLSDRVALGSGDPDAEALWQAHVKRQRAALGAVRVNAPAANIPRADPYALRVAATAALVLGYLYAGPEWQERLREALSPDFQSAASTTAAIDAWITPPAYVNDAPIFLDHTVDADTKEAIEVPEGSVLTVRASGLTRSPTLRRTLTEETRGTSEKRVSLAFEEEADKAHKLEMPIEASAMLEVLSGRTQLRKWNVTYVPDRAPRVSFEKAPVPSERGTLEVSYNAEDDHGLESISLSVEPARAEEAHIGASVIDLTEPLQADLRMKGRAPGSAKETVLVDLASHPWAGHEVIVRLIARDETGQTGTSEPVTLVLPERQFADPLARAIIEQRTAIATDVDNTVDLVLTALDALTLAPERFMPDKTLYLGLRVAYHRLSGRLEREVVRSVYDLMWNLALRTEDGDLSVAEQRLREAQEALAQALDNGASDEEISQLTQALREALDEFMAALSEQLQQAIESGDYAALPQAAESLSSQDLDQMLNAIEQMSRSGAREAARDLLSQMQQLMERLQLGAGPQELTQEQSAMADALNALGDLVEEQRALMDETFRQSGQASKPQDGDRGTNELARDQAELRERLEQLLGAMDDAGVPPNRSLGQAGDAMGRAQDDLSADDPGSAVPDQNEALARLQEGMSDLSEQLSQSLGSGFSLGQSGSAGRDPLGRGNDVEVPDEGALQRARQILEDIKRRASDPNREREELDYLERLVPKF